MTRIKDKDELQYRQIHPNCMKNCMPLRVAFAPTGKDAGKLSFDRSASITAEESHDAFQARGLKSTGVHGLTPGGCSEEPNPIECFAVRSQIIRIILMRTLVICPRARIEENP